MGRLDNGSWWWDTALDGVVGGLIGGVMTGLAVWLTLRHEGRLARMSAVETASARLQALSLRFARNLAAGHGTVDSFWDQQNEVHTMAFDVFGRATRDWPRYAKAVLDLANEMNSALTGKDESEKPDVLKRRDNVVSVLTAICSATASWMTEHSIYEAPSRWRAWWRRVLVTPRRLLALRRKRP
jgi:hypothetical protein